MNEPAASALQYAHMNSSIGMLHLIGDDRYLRHILFHTHSLQLPPHWQRIESLPYPNAKQLNAHFAGTLSEFDLPISPEGITFQLEVWDSLEEIPYAETISYTELARRVCKPEGVPVPERMQQLSLF